MPLVMLVIGTGATDRRTSRLTSGAFGAGAALTLDEFALWLNLQDVYWAKQGRESIDAVILFGALLSMGLIGKDFLRELARLGKDLGREELRSVALGSDGRAATPAY